MRRSRKMAVARISMMGAPPPTIQRQPIIASSPLTIRGPIQSPTFPVDRCIEMNNPRRSGKRCASSPRAGGCHMAVPADAIASAASTCQYAGDIDTRK